MKATLERIQSGEAFDKDDCSLPLEQLLGVSNASLGARLDPGLQIVDAEREYVAETLRRSLLPPELPGIEGLEIAARYLPAAEGDPGRRRLLRRLRGRARPV